MKVASIKDLTNDKKTPLKRIFTKKRKSLSSDFSFSKKQMAKNRIFQKKPIKSYFNKKNKIKQRKVVHNTNKKRRTINYPTQPPPQQNFIAKYKKKLLQKKKTTKPQSNQTNYINSNFSNFFPENNNQTSSQHLSNFKSNHIDSLPETPNLYPSLNKLDEQIKKIDNLPNFQMFKSLKTFYKNKERKEHDKNVYFKDLESRTKKISHTQRHKKNKKKLTFEKVDSEDEGNQTFTFEITHSNKNTILYIRKNDDILGKLRKYAKKEKLRESAYKQLVLMVKRKIDRHTRKH
jgi:hypothetical protein